MKKNLRIVSAAAAALLAVAPVAATAVVSAPTSTVQAANALGFKKGDKIILNADVAATYTSKGQKLNYTIKKGTEVTVVTTPGANGVTVNNGKTNLEVAKEAYKILVKNFTLVQTPASHTTGAEEVKDSYMRAKSQEELHQHGAYATGNTIYAGADVSSMVNSFDSLRAAIQKYLVWYGYDVNENGNSKHHQYSPAEWDKYVWADNSATNQSNLKSQLEGQGISVSANGKFDPADKAFKIEVRSNFSNTVTIWFQNTDYVDQTAPVIFGWYTQYRQKNLVGNNTYTTTYGQNKDQFYNRAKQPVKDASGYVRPLIVEQHDDGTFQPTEYFGAWNNNKQHGTISVTAKSSDVDWTKPGLYSVSLTATNAAKKTEDVTVPVIVTAKNGNVMTVVNNTNVYTEENGQMVQANLVNFSNLVNPGNQVVVYGSSVTKKLNGVDTPFFRIVSPTANFYIPAKDLKNGVVNTPAAETTKTVTIMHISAIYDKNGVATHDPALRAYDTYSVVSEPVTINGAKFYKLAGKDQYIKVGNVDGTSRSLKHNSYVYKSTGKRANKKTLKKGSSVTTYGKSFMIAGHQMYRIGKNQYVKKANF